MMERDYGRIVNIASVAGKEGNPKSSPYSAVKAGVIGLTKSLGKELALTGIRVNCVTPAVVMTRPVKEAEPELVQYMVERIPMGRPGKSRGKRCPRRLARVARVLVQHRCRFRYQRRAARPIDATNPR